MTRILIACSRPGFRRAGIEHPASKVYEPGELTDKQLDALRAEPSITVTELADASSPEILGGLFVLHEMRAAISAAIKAGFSRVFFAAEIAAFIDREWITQQGASGTAREAPSAGSGSDALQASDGVQPAPPSIISEAQQPAPEGDAGQKAEPEAELAHAIGKEAAQASDNEVTSLANPTAETGEVSEADAAAASDAAATAQSDAPAPEAVAGKPVKSRRKAS